MAISAAQLNVRIQTEGASKAKGEIASMGDAVDDAGSKSKRLGGALLGFGGAVAGMFTYGAREAISFGEQMANVNSIIQVSNEELAALSDEVIALGTASGQAPTTLAAGLYDIASSGFEGAEGLKVLEAAAYSATAGMTTTDVAAKGITAVLNAYKLSADDAARVSDIMFAVVDKGVISFAELSSNLGNTIPLANALGIAFEEVGAAYALMTKSGIAPSQAETQIAALMRSAINPTAELTTAVQDYGYANVEALIAAEGMTGYLAVLNIASGGSKEALFDLLGTTEAVNAALVLGGDNAGEYAEMLDYMERSSEGLGATQTALAKQMESTAFSLRLLKTNIQAAAIAIGVQLEPGIKAVAKAMTAAIKVFLNLPKPVQKVIGIVTALAGVLALAAGAVILFGSQIAAAGALFLSLLGPIGLVVAAVGGLYYAWQSNLFGIRDIAADAGAAILDFLSPLTEFIDGFKNTWDDLGLGEIFGNDGDAAGDFDSHLTSLTGALGITTAAVGATATALGFGERVLRSFADGLRAIGGDDTPAFFVGLASAIDRVANGLASSGLSGMFSAIREELSALSAIDIAISIGEWAFSSAADIAVDLYNWIDGQVGDFVQDIPGIIVNVGEWIQGALPNLWDAITGWAFGYGADNGMSGDGTGGARPGQEITIGEVAVNIGKWIKGTWDDLWETVEGWVLGGGPEGTVSGAAKGGQGVTLNEVAVHIGGWLVEAATPLWTAIEDQLVAWISGGGGGGAGIPTGAVGGGGGGGGITLPDAIRVRVSDWALEILDRDTSGDISAGEVTAWIDAALTGLIGVDVEVQNWKMDLANPENDLTVADVVTWVDDILTGIIGVDVELQTWKLDLANPDNDLTVMDVIGWIDDMLEGLIGVDVELQTWKLELADPEGDLTAADVIRWIDTQIEGLTGIEVELQNWELSIDLDKALTPFRKMAEGFNNMFGPGSPVDKAISAGPEKLLALFQAAWEPFGDSLSKTWDDLTNIELNPLDWDWGSLIPEPEWPDWLTTTPDWWTNIQAGRMPWDDGGGSGGDSGLDPDWKSIDAPGGMSGPHRGMMPDLQFGGDWSGIIDQISGVRVEMDGVKVAAQDTGIALDTAFGSGFDTSGITGAVSIAKTELQSLVTSAQLMTLSMAMAGRNLGQAFGTGVSAGVTSAAGQVSSAVSGLITTAVGYNFSAIKAGMSIGSSFGAGMATGIRSQSGSVSSAASGLVAAAGNHRFTALKAGLGIGSSLGAGIAAGIRSQLGNVVAQAVGIVNAAIGAAKLAGEITSPSKVMREDVGQMLGLGAVLGVQDMYGAMSGAMAGLISVPTVPYTAGGGLRGGSQGGGGQTVNLTVNLNVEGNIAAEDEFGDRVSTRLVNALTDEIERHRAAVGVN